MKPFGWVENDADSSAKPIQDLSDDTLLRPQKNYQKFYDMII